MNQKPNTQLSTQDLPSHSANWENILPFALTFNGYNHWGSFKQCREVANRGIQRYRGKQDLNLTLTDLRTCLFFEVRRWKHYQKDPTPKGMAYIHALVEAIRIRVVTQEIE